MNPYRANVPRSAEHESAPFDDGFSSFMMLLGLSRIIAATARETFFCEESALAFALVVLSFRDVLGRLRKRSAPRPSVERRASKRFKILT